MSSMMSMRNRYLQILAKNHVSSKNVNKIMADLDRAGIFDEEIIIDEDFGYEYDIIAEQEAEAAFGEISIAAKKEKLSQPCEKKRTALQEQNERIFQERFKSKVAEMSQDLQERGICSFEEMDLNMDDNGDPIRYGRNKLHEAIALRDMNLIKELVENEPYLIEGIDNNGHTPFEMSYYEGFAEAYNYLKDKIKLVSVK